MFHAANSQFLHVASRQKQFARLSLLSDQAPIKEEEAEQLANSRWRRILRGLERADRIDRMMVFIGVGLVLQFLLTLLVFLGSKKFHQDFGLWDWDVQGTGPELRMKCSKGWEWWLSIVWQFFWAWMAPVNAYFMPPSWFSACIFVMELVTIGFPILEIFQTHKLRQETLDAIKAWEKRQEVTSPSSSAFSEVSTKVGARSSKTFSIKEVNLGKRASLDSQRSDLYTMAGLENALRTNATPLLQFAALKDFSGENVSFLTHLADWRRSWLHLKVSTAQHRREQFIAAVSIYAHFVSPNFSEFPINICSRNYTGLRDLFDEAASRIFRKRSISSSYSPTPFEDVAPDSDSTVDLRSGISLNALGRANLEAVAQMVESGQQEAEANVNIPESFRETVFDAAEREIKYLVLTNTWPKFVNAAYASSQHDAEKQAQAGNWLRKAIPCAT
ncbi:hypothetical protein N0V90_007574 [Kalmusia sp. IMI 367209]|nr:hypothetical protein N0V90_007574 [Kalmusia sp. IMI 367209]